MKRTQFYLAIFAASRCRQHIKFNVNDLYYGKPDSNGSWRYNHEEHRRFGNDTLSGRSNSLKEVLASRLTDDPEASVEIGTIDGKDGVIGFGLPICDENLLQIENETSFEYFYWPDSEKCECVPVYVGKTMVRVVGPWISEWDDAIARSLLDSLMVTETA